METGVQHQFELDDASPQEKGGRARAEKLTPEERKEIARKGAQARWDAHSNLPRAAYMGHLTIGNMTFPCSVLSDGTRILTQSDFMSGMGMYYSGWVAKNRPRDAASAGVPHFLAFKSLKPFIGKHLGDLQSITLTYRTEKGGIAHGIKAETIPRICEVWLDAEESGRLGARQKAIAQKAKLLMRALAHVGIIALIDEATGYQEVRDRKALEEILNKYISEELRKWTATFPDDYFTQVFRLKNWKMPSFPTARPGIMAHYTNDIVYSRLAPGVLAELQQRNPTDGHGRRKHKLFQYLTSDHGHPKLKEHLRDVVLLMTASSSWHEFRKLLDRAKPRVNAPGELPLSPEPEQDA
jgi:hypothetical protein